MIVRPLLVVASLFLLSACEQLGIETPLQMEQKRAAEGKALGGSCRQAGRALEDCYQINPRFPKAAIFDGWKDMDAYMRENKLDNIAPEFPMSPPESKKKAAEAEEEVEARPAKKAAQAEATEVKPANKGTQAEEETEAKPVKKATTAS